MPADAAPKTARLKPSVPMRALPPSERVASFAEVERGYSEGEARAEADRCLQCARPLCREGCPAGNDVPAMVRAVREGRYREAFESARSYDCFPAVTSRVCPHEAQCEGSCVLGKRGEPVRIGAVERFAAERGWCPPPRAAPPTGRRVAVVGSGPAGLACARELALLGHAVTVFEARPMAGGLLSYGIPEYRLPKAVVAREVGALRGLGVRFETGRSLGSTLAPDALKGYDAVFVATGETAPYGMGIPGEDLKGVHRALDLLVQANLAHAGVEGFEAPTLRGTVAVVGGGNVAMDSARVARRLGAERVLLVYRRSEAEMPATRKELAQVREEGVELMFLTNPVRVIGRGGRVVGVECVRMRLGEPDASGRPRPVPIPGSEFALAADAVVMAIGQSPDPAVGAALPSVERSDRWGHLKADEDTCATADPRVFAGGDVARGGGTVVAAILDGRRAARAMHERLGGKRG